jgi:hypothetical protein
VCSKCTRELPDFRYQATTLATRIEDHRLVHRSFAELYLGIKLSSKLPFVRAFDARSWGTQYHSAVYLWSDIVREHCPRLSLYLGLLSKTKRTPTTARFLPEVEMSAFDLRKLCSHPSTPFVCANTREDLYQGVLRTRHYDDIVLYNGFKYPVDRRSGHLLLRLVAGGTKRQRNAAFVTLRREKRCCMCNIFTLEFSSFEVDPARFGEILTCDVCANDEVFSAKKAKRKLAKCKHCSKEAVGSENWSTEKKKKHRCCELKPAAKAVQREDDED